MKKYFILICLFYLTSAVTYAQKTSWFHFGIKAGTNLSQLKTGSFIANGQYNGQTLNENLKQSWDTHTGFVGGAYLRFGRTIFLQPEVLYSGKGGSYLVQVIDSNGDPIGDPQTVKVKTETIDVPLLLGLKLGPIRINAGPVASFLIGSDESIKDAIEKYTNDSAQSTFNQAVWGYQVGGGLDIGRLSVDVRYEDNLSNLRFINLETSTGSNPFTQKTKNWQVTLGLRLF
ncbi:MAG: outer membrane beta-barrel protein [Siphonobacter sp.]